MYVCEPKIKSQEENKCERYVLCDLKRKWLSKKYIGNIHGKRVHHISSLRLSVNIIAYDFFSSYQPTVNQCAICPSHH